MSKRIEYIDIAKGIGILLVVMGHNDFGLVSPFFSKFIYSFHMPLFFFVSGMVFKSDLPFFKMLRRRYETLLKPYIVTILLIYFMTLSFTKVNFNIATARVFKSIYATGHYIDWVQLWFLPHLFALNIFGFAYYKIVRVFDKPWFRLTILVIMQIIGVSLIRAFWPFTVNILSRSFTLFGLPLGIDLILVSGFFFILGCEVNKLVPAVFIAHPLTLAGSLAGLLALLIFLPQTIDFNIRIFQSLPINTLEAILGILFILSISKQIERISRLSAGFRYIGQASLFILIFHVPIQEAWGEKLLAVINNQTISFWLSYIAGVTFPLLINYFAIQPNPIIRAWFGQSNKPAEHSANQLLAVTDDNLPH